MTRLSNFGGSVTVSLPYELKEGEDLKNVKVWHLAADGSMTEIPCTYDPSTKKVSFIVSHFSLYMVGVTSTQVNPFTDVNEDDWFYNAVSFVNENGLMTGTGETTFSPAANTSRGMIVTILWRLEGEPVAESPLLTNVGDGKWYYKAVAWAAENGIVDGYSADKFGPEDNITREQMAKILCSCGLQELRCKRPRRSISIHRQPLRLGSGICAVGSCRGFDSRQGQCYP